MEHTPHPSPEISTDNPHDAAPIGVVIVNYAASALIAANVPDLDPARARVVVVDNLSTPAERTAVSTVVEARGWSLVEMAGNPGFGPGVNAGVRRAQELGCSSFLFLNPDAVVTADTVEALRQACLADHLVLVAPHLLNIDGAVFSAGTTLNLVDGRMRGLRSALAAPDPTARPVSWVTAACLAVHRELWDRVGGYDEGFFMYWEDVDFVFRGLQAGGHVVLRSDLSAVHDQGGTQGPRRGHAKSALYYYYNCRNRLLFGTRHLARGDLLRWVLTTPRVSWEILLHGGRRQLLHQPQLAWSAASGGLVGMWWAARHLFRVSVKR